MAIFDNSEIERRHSVYPLEAVGRRRSLTDTMDEYKQHAIALGRDVTARALATARLGAADIDLFITVSCTGIIIPSLTRTSPARWDSALTCAACRSRSWDARRGRRPARARDFLCGFPDANVLVVSVELPSLSLQLEDLTLDNLVSRRAVR